MNPSNLPSCPLIASATYSLHRPWFYLPVATTSAIVAGRAAEQCSG